MHKEVLEWLIQLSYKSIWDPLPNVEDAVTKAIRKIAFWLLICFGVLISLQSVGIVPR